MRSPSLTVSDTPVKSGRPGLDAETPSASMRIVGTAGRIMVT
jgi:hypothetical protein